MKVIFLDIDGVLLPITHKDKHENQTAMVSPKIMCTMHKILEETGAKIVICSAWRHNMEYVKQLFDESTEPPGKRLWDYVISKTPAETGGGRSTEILQWLDDYHKTCKDGEHITNWIVLDDEGYDLKAIKRLNKLVKPESHIGVTREQADFIINYFNNESQ